MGTKRRFNDVEDLLVKELLETAFEAVSLLDDANGPKADVRKFKKQILKSCYHGRRRSKSCRDAYNTMLEVLDETSDRELAGMLSMSEDEVTELRAGNSHKLLDMVLDADG